MKRISGTTLNKIGRAFGLVLVPLLFLTTTSFSQDDAPQMAPPPQKVIPKEERSRIESEGDMRSRTRLVLEMMERRLASAEKFHRAEDFRGVFADLGVFQGLMENGLSFLLKNNPNSGKVLDNLKRLEIGLRAFAPRLESIRREVPLRFEDYLRRLIKQIRDTRAKALDPLFGETVISADRQ